MTTTKKREEPGISAQGMALISGQCPWPPARMKKKAGDLDSSGRNVFDIDLNYK